MRVSITRAVLILSFVLPGVYATAITDEELGAVLIIIGGDDETADTIPPDTTIISGPSDPSNTTMFTFSSTEPGSTFECNLDDAGFEPCESPLEYAGLDDGVHTFLVRATDPFGNTDPTPAPEEGPYTWTHDTVPPITIFNSGPDSLTNSPSATFEFTSNEPGSFECAIDGGLFTSCSSPRTYPGLAEGAHTFQVRAIDLAGNVDVTPAPIPAFTWTIDLTPPVTQVTSGPESPTKSTSATFEFEADEAASFECWIEGGPFEACVSPKSYTELVAGEKTFQARAIDLAGNVGLPDDYQWTIDTTLPQGTSVSINLGAKYAVAVEDVSARLQATDAGGITDYLVTEHNATDPGNVVPPYVDPAEDDAGWVAVTSTTSLDTTLTVPLQGSHQKGDLVEICAWFKDESGNVSERLCGAIIYGVSWEDGIGNWSADNGVWQVGTPTAGPASCFEGAQCAGTVLGGNYPANTDSRLISPSFELPAVVGVEELHLRFRHWFSYGDSSDSGQVQVSVFDPVTSTFGDWINEGTAIFNSSGWSLKDVDLTAYAGERVRIAFFHTSTAFNFGPGWFVDEIMVEKLSPTFSGDFEAGWDQWGADGGVWQVGTPGAGPPSCFSGTECAGTNLDGNYPANTDTRLVSATLQLDTVTGSEEIHLRFRQWFSYGDSSDSGQVQVSLWDPVTSTFGAWVNEGPANFNASGWSLKDVDLTAYAGERVRIAFLHSSTAFNAGTGWYIDDVVVQKTTPAFTGDFEAGWAQWGADGGVWQVGTPTAGPPSCFGGTQCAGTNLDGNYPANTASRLVSATLQLDTVTGSEEIHLRFYQWFSYGDSSDSGQVQVSLWDPVTSTFGAWVNEGPANFNASGWSLKDVDLTAYAGERVRIAFLHSSTAFNAGTGWYIDDVVVQKTTPAFTGDFEAGWAQWGADGGVWQVGAPTVGPPSCFSGSAQCAGTNLDGNYPANTASRLVSATLQLDTVTASEEIHLRFRQWFAYGDSSDSGQVQVSVWDPVTSTFGAWVNEGLANLDNSGGWSLKDVDLTAYAGERVRIAFLHSSTAFNFGAGWYIDDVVVQKATPMFTGDFFTGWAQWGADRGVWQVGQATAGPGSCFGGLSCAGTRLGSNYPVNTDSRLISATVELPEVTGFEEIHFRFNQWFSYGDSSDSGQVQVSVWDPVTSTFGAWVNEGPANFNDSGGVWSLKDVLLTAYAGERVRIAFYHTSTAFNVGPGWYVDDITIEVF